MKSPSNIDDYITGFPADIREILQKIRGLIQKTAPYSAETMKYGIPTFYLNGNLVHFAAFKNHIGFYPTPGAIKHFRKDLSEYKCSTGAIRFPLDKKIPYRLISQIVKYRVKENLQKQLTKR